MADNPPPPADVVSARQRILLLEAALWKIVELRPHTNRTRCIQAIEWASETAKAALNSQPPTAPSSAAAEPEHKPCPGCGAETDGDFWRWKCGSQDPGPKLGGFRQSDECRRAAAERCPKCGGEPRGKGEFDCGSFFHDNGNLSQSPTCLIGDLREQLTSMTAARDELLSSRNLAVDAHKETIIRTDKERKEAADRLAEVTRERDALTEELKSAKHYGDHQRAARMEAEAALNAAIEAERERHELQLRLRAADYVAAAVDFDIHARLMNPRSRIADARLQYGEIFSPEECMKLLRIPEHPATLAASLVDSWKDDAIAAATSRAEKAEADNAIIVDRLSALAAMHACQCGSDGCPICGAVAAVAQPHPGVALLERVRNVEAAATAVVHRSAEFVDRLPCVLNILVNDLEEALSKSESA